MLAHACLNCAAREDLSSSTGEYFGDIRCLEEVYAGCNLFQMLCSFQICLLSTPEVSTLVLGQHMFQCAHQPLLKYMFFHILQIISTFFYTYFMLFFETMSSPQYNLV